MSELLLIATPIGNLKDITERAKIELASVDFILCEDTRTTAKLLSHYGISTPTRSYHLHNEHKITSDIISILQSGKRIALVSDAGMPGISDPGFLLVRKAHQNGVKVSVLPGANAVLTALTASGLPSDRFIFEGFLPPKKGRKKRIESWIDEERTVILYESVHRIEKLLEEIQINLGDERFIAVCRELTKYFEEIIRGRLADVKLQCEQHSHLKGEFVVIIAGCNYTEEGDSI